VCGGRYEGDNTWLRGERGEERRDGKKSVEEMEW
jgi:hypothetical protein